MDHTKSLKHEHRLHNIVVPEFRYIRAARVVSRGRDFNTLPNRTFVPFVSVAQNVCCLSLFREMVRLSQLDRGRAIALILQGRSQREVAQQFGVHELTISRLVQRLRATGRLTDRPRSGSLRVTTQRQDRRIRLVYLRNRLRTATETAREVIGTHGRRVCGQSEIACESSIYVHAVLTWARTLRLGDVIAACNGCVPMHQIGFDWLTGGV